MEYKTSFIEVTHLPHQTPSSGTFVPTKAPSTHQRRAKRQMLISSATTHERGFIVNDSNIN